MLRCYLCNGTGKRTKFLIPIQCDFCSGQGYVSARSSSKKAASSNAAATSSDSMDVLQLNHTISPLFTENSSPYEAERDRVPAACPVPEAAVGSSSSANYSAGDASGGEGWGGLDSSSSSCD